MLVEEQKSSLESFPKDLVDDKPLTVQAQRLIPYPDTKKPKHPSEEVKQKNQFYSTWSELGILLFLSGLKNSTLPGWI